MKACQQQIVMAACSRNPLPNRLYLAIVRASCCDGNVTEERRKREEREAEQTYSTIMRNGNTLPSVLYDIVPRGDHLCFCDVVGFSVCGARLRLKWHAVERGEIGVEKKYVVVTRLADSCLVRRVGNRSVLDWLLLPSLSRLIDEPYHLFHYDAHASCVYESNSVSTQREYVD